MSYFLQGQEWLCLDPEQNTSFSNGTNLYLQQPFLNRCFTPFKVRHPFQLPRASRIKPFIHRLNRSCSRNNSVCTSYWGWAFSADALQGKNSQELFQWRGLPSIRAGGTKSPLFSSFSKNCFENWMTFESVSVWCVFVNTFYFDRAGIKLWFLYNGWTPWCSDSLLLSFEIFLPFLKGCLLIFASRCWLRFSLIISSSKMHKMCVHFQPKHVYLKKKVRRLTPWFCQQVKEKHKHFIFDRGKFLRIGAVWIGTAIPVVEREILLAVDQQWINLWLVLAQVCITPITSHLCQVKRAFVHNINPRLRNWICFHSRWNRWEFFALEWGSGESRRGKGKVLNHSYQSAPHGSLLSSFPINDTCPLFTFVIQNTGASLFCARGDSGLFIMFLFSWTEKNIRSKNDIFKSFPRRKQRLICVFVDCQLALFALRTTKRFGVLLFCCCCPEVAAVVSTAFVCVLQKRKIVQYKCVALDCGSYPTFNVPNWSWISSRSSLCVPEVKHWSGTWWHTIAQNIIIISRTNYCSSTRANH